MVEKSVYGLPAFAVRGLNAQGLAVPGVGHLDSAGFQAQTTDVQGVPEKAVVVGIPMFDVPQQRVRYAVKVAADLMPATRHRIDFNQRVTGGRVLFPDSIRKFDFGQLSVQGQGFGQSAALIDFQRNLDAAFTVNETANDGVVSFFHQTFGEKSVQLPGAVAGHGKQHDATGRGIQAMHGENVLPEHLSEVIQADSFLGHRIGGQFRRMDEKARRFVDGKKVFVLVQDF